MESKPILSDTNVGGVLLNDEIKKLIDNWRLIEDADADQIQPASYDARIGTGYYQDGKLQEMDAVRNPWIEVPSNDMVLVSTWETFNMPNNIVARYYLRQGLTWKGLVLLGAGQIDPGYHGKIFGLLYNFSRNAVRIGCKEHIFTVEFCYTTRPTGHSRAYSGPYQRAMSLTAILPVGLSVDSGSEAIQERLDELTTRLTTYRQESEKLTERFFVYLAVVIALFALLEVIVGVVALLIAIRGG
jgi:deoxycytidine triphosphate deaminase